MPLTDLKVKNAKPKDKPYKLADEKGLYLHVRPSGRSWKYDYRFQGKRNTASYGTYPLVSLAAAREKHQEARRLLAQGHDPNSHGKTSKDCETGPESNRFEAIAREWFQKQVPIWAPSHASTVLSRLERLVFPAIGSLNIVDITPPQVLACVQRVEATTVETAHRTLSICGQVFRYAIATGKVQHDVTTGLKQALAPVKGKHFHAITDPRKVGPLLRAIDSYQGNFVTRCALRLVPLVFVRPGELRTAKWDQIDLAAAEWRFIASKTHTPHIVPLSMQALKILHEVREITGRGEYVFTGPRSNRPLSDNTLPLAIRSLGFEHDKMTVHGFRAMARTILEEVLDYRYAVIELQLAHAVPDPNGRAYNRTAHLTKRKEMMQQWADYLDALRAAATSA